MIRDSMHAMRSGFFAAISTFALLGSLHAQRPDAPAIGTASIAGRVVDAVTGRPVPGARVFASREPDVPNLPTRISDANGTFVLTELPAGSYRLGASRGGYLGGEYGQRRPGGGSSRITLEDGIRRADLVIRMWPDASISGRVVDERGEGVAGVPVYALERHDDMDRYIVAGSSSTTNDLGEYRISRLKPGEYAVATNCRMISRVLATAVRPAVPAIGHGATSGDYGWTSHYLVDASGKAVAIPQCPLLPDLPSRGTRTFVASVAGAARLRDGLVVPLELGDARPHVDIQLQTRPAARIAGVVTNPGGPIEGAMVRLVRDDWDGPEFLSDISAHVARDGTFIMPIVPAGQYTLVAWRQLPPVSDARVTADGQLTSGMDDVVISDETAAWARMPLAVGTEPVTDLAVTLRPGTKVSGRVEIDSTNPPARLPLSSVFLHPLAGRFYGAGAVANMVDGRFTVLLRPGSYMAEARTASQAWRIQSVAVNGRTVGLQPIEIGTTDVELVVTLTDRVATLSGDVLGETAEYAVVIVFPVNADARSLPAPEDQPFWSHRLVQVQRAEAGHFTFSTLVPGEYFVAAVDDGVVPGRVSGAFLERLSRIASRIQVVAGQPSSISLQVRKP